MRAGKNIVPLALVDEMQHTLTDFNRGNRQDAELATLLERMADLVEALRYHQAKRVQTVHFSVSPPCSTR